MALRDRISSNLDGVVMPAVFLFSFYDIMCALQQWVNDVPFNFHSLWNPENKVAGSLAVYLC